MSKTKKTKVKKTSSDIKYKKIFWGLFLAASLFVLFLFVLVSFTKMPSRESLENPKYELSSVIYTDDMEELGSYYTKNRDWVPFTEINPHVIDALVATEDERYYSHTGIDVIGTMRAVAFFGQKGGASTITQQLAKQFYTPKPANYLVRVWQKMKEWVIATEFEKRYTKQEIIAMLLNKYDFIYGANGIGAAAKVYFGKNQADLTLQEAAVLVGMFKNPSFYNPVSNPENAARRTKTVLFQMVKNDYLSREEYDELKDQEIDMSNFNRPTHYKGKAPYFRGELKKYINEILDAEENRKSDGSKYNIYQDGLRIYTTINSKMQEYAEEAVWEHMENLQDTYWNRWKGKDPWSYRLKGEDLTQAKNHLRGMIRSSDRYIKMRSATLGKPIAILKDEVKGARLRDVDIRRMVNEGKKKGYLKKLKSRKVISNDQLDNYKKIMASENWATLVKAYAQLQKDVKRVFNKKRKMKVFAYNSAGEKTVEMSPLDSIKYHHQHMQVGSLSIEPHTGYVRSWVGGVNYKYFQYDHVRSRRQVGSTFKPFIYATAVSNGISPCYRIQDRQYIIAKGSSGFNVQETYKPRNTKPFTNNWVTLYQGLKESTNSISIGLLKEIGSVEPVRDLASNFGIPKDDIPPYPSIALGVPELRVMDMAAAYTTFANNGTYTEPIFIKRIEDKNGKVIYQGIPEVHTAMNPKYNYAMLDLLRNAASILKNKGIQSDVGGKTGTTNDHVDGWFMGVTPSLVVGTWVGGDSKYIRFRSLADGQGGVMARPIFTKFMKRLEADPSIYDINEEFVVPGGDMIELDCAKYDALVQPDTTSSEIIEIEDEFDEEF